MNKIKYRFEVWYRTKPLAQVAEFLAKLDLGMEYVCYKDSIVFSYTKEEKPVQYFKDLIKQAMEMAECVLVHVEGGKVE